MNSMCQNMKVPNDQGSENVENHGDSRNVVDVGNEADHQQRAPHSPSREGDFSEYLWMENEEEFEAQVLRQLEEEALMQQCIEAMQDEHYNNPNDNDNHSSDQNIVYGMDNLLLNETSAQQSKLNPDAAEFVPRFSATPAKEEKSSAE